MDIRCAYRNDDPYGYACDVSNHRILDDTKLEFIGKHEEGRTDNDVKFITFGSCNISKVPKKLTEKFPNLEGLQFFKSDLKNISRSDLLEYRNFKWLFFIWTNIEYLPGDLFADCKKLERIIFGGNPLTTVEPNILNGLEKLHQVNISDINIKYGRIYSESIIAHDDPRLVEMKEKLHEMYSKSSNSKMKKDYVKKLCRDNEELTKLKSFFQTDEALKDFCINIGDKQFRVHKTFLAARSSTLAEILRNSPDAENLNLVDITVDIFEGILKYLYTDELPEEIDFMQLFAAAGRLKIDDLKEHAAKKIIEKLDHENAPEVLSLSSKYNHELMKGKAFENIKRKYSNIELKEEWLNKDENVEKMVEHLQKIRKIEKDLADSMH